MTESRRRAIRAAVCERVGEPLRIERLHLESPGPNEVLVATRTCAVCHSDISFVDGAWGEVPPTVFGHEVAGVVEEVGSGVRLNVGQHVLVSLIRSCGRCRPCRAGHPVLCETTFLLDQRSPLSSSSGGSIAQGLRCAGFADAVTVHESQVVPVPEGVPFSTAAVVACAGITGIGAVRNTAALPLARHVVVIGAGGVGLNAIQAAALRDPVSLTAVDVADVKLGPARIFGASDVFAGPGDEAVARVRETTGGGADFVFVTVGATAAVEQALRMTGRGGTVVLVGMPATGAYVSIEPSTLAADEIRILGSKMGSTELQRDVPRIFEEYERGWLKLDELVSGTFPLNDIDAAFQAAVAPESTRVVIEFP